MIPGKLTSTKGGVGVSILISSLEEIPCQTAVVLPHSIFTTRNLTFIMDHSKLGFIIGFPDFGKLPKPIASYDGSYAQSS